MDRLAKVGVHYIAPDAYLYTRANTDSRSAIFKHYDVLSRFCRRLQTADPGKTIITVPQLFSGVGDWRAPSRNEVLASAYVSLLVGAKGVCYYFSGPFDGIQQPLYSFPDPGDVLDRTSRFYDKMFDMRQMNQEKVAALRTFAGFIHGKTGEADGLTHGDLLATIGIDRHSIVGTTNGIDVVNVRDFSPNEIGDTERVDFSKITITGTGGGTPTGPAMVGVAHLRNLASRPNVSYFLFTNLGARNETLRLRLSLRSVNQLPSVRVSNLTFPDDMTNRGYFKNGQVSVVLPASAAMIIKIENSNTL